MENEAFEPFRLICIAHYLSGRGRVTATISLSGYSLCSDWLCRSCVTNDVKQTMLNFQELAEPTNNW